MPSRLNEYPVGTTALCVYALLASGVPVDDGSIKRGFAFLDKAAKTAEGWGFSAYELSATLLATTATSGAPFTAFITAAPASRQRP